MSERSHTEPTIGQGARNVRLLFMYRDASNWKFPDAAVFEGPLLESERSRLLSGLSDGEYFIASEVGLRDPQQDVPGFPSSDDHVWSELVELEETSADATHGSFAAFVQRVEDASWDVQAAASRLGL